MRFRMGENRVGRAEGRNDMKIINREYFGGVVSLLLLIFGILLLPFGIPGLPRTFALSWIAVVLLPTVAFIGKARKKEQLSAIRRRWKKKGVVYREDVMEPEDENLNRRSRENNAD